MDLLCFDLETAPNWALIAEHEEDAEAFCLRKKILQNDLGLYPQWGKIVGAAWGYSREEIISEVGDNEGEILGVFYDVLMEQPTLLGHFIKGFDIPFLVWRILANKLRVPPGLKLAGKKPWEIPHIDTHELLKFGGHGSASLNDACVAFGLQSPKGAVNGSMISDLVRQGEWGKIRAYVVGDVRADMELYRFLIAGGAA